MVLDTSALLAILQNEPERRVFTDAIESAEMRLLSTASFVEASLVVESRYGPEGVRDLDALISVAQLKMVAVDSDQAYVARAAYRKYGKGRHPAALNFGDCFSYALATTTGDALLFKGGDFALTDVNRHAASCQAT